MDVLTQFPNDCDHWLVHFQALRPRQRPQTFQDPQQATGNTHMG